MEVIHTVAALRKRVLAAKVEGKIVGLVPTMGALHDGHISLMHRARKECGLVVVSLFINPTQFGPREDLSRYPRDLEGDREKTLAARADLLFVPDVAELYLPNASTWVSVDCLTDELEGASRPGHFRGVATVVAKLFNASHADRAYFGEKDYQQLQVVRRMARDLCFQVQVVACPTVREADGLAMSSRNRYLDRDQRMAAASLSQALFAARELFDRGVRDPTLLLTSAREVLDNEPGVQVSYLELVDSDTMVPAVNLDRPAVILVAATVGNTRLIDNVTLEV